jgi:hypothetical protein
MSDFDLVAHEIGVKGHLSDVAAFTAAFSFALAVLRMPEPQHHLLIGGFDDDPREVWDIPEAREYLCQFSAALHTLFPDRHPGQWRLDDQSLGMLAMCLGVAKIVGRDPTTGEFTIAFGGKKPH